jgi:hypothetical protein
MHIKLLKEQQIFVIYGELRRPCNGGDLRPLQYHS